MEQSLAITRRRLALDASAQSERAQMAAAADLLRRLGDRLSMPDEAANLSHAHVLAWKGASFAAQRARRLFVQARADPETRKAAEALLAATRSLALLARREEGASRERLEELSRMKEGLEGRLAERSETFRASLTPPSGGRLRALLPRGAALVDFLEYHGLDPAKPPAGQARAFRLAAWVLRPDAETVRVDLGPAGPIFRAVRAWRAGLERGLRALDEGARVRGLVWAPIEKHLAGCSLVLLSPDGGLGRVPFAALPGARPGTFLLEEAPLAFVPIPQAFPTGGPPGGPGALLVVGGVDYSARPGPDAAGPAAVFAALPGTVREADAVARMFRPGRVASLSGGDATKAAVREALGKARYAHLATHGFFAPASMRSVLRRPPGSVFGSAGVAGHHPGLLSGLAFAGANRPTEEDDGVLTALEVSEMDLSNMDLAVLSACQTGLGMEAAGEGMLGLQRAFAVAGCRSVVSSLWSVDDAATAVLMERFYHHLWGKKLPKAEALRQAQIDVLRHPEWVEDRVKKVPGLRGVGKASEAVAGEGVRRSPPAWWAAWQLSGGWR
jgi:CHAT domain-containing protein